MRIGLMKLIAYQDVDAPFVSYVINYYLNFLRKKTKVDTSKNENYQLVITGSQISPDEVAIVKNQTTLSITTSTKQLAYDFKKKCWYTDATNKLSVLEKFLERLVVLDLTDRPLRAQCSAEEQRVIINFLQHIPFLTPYFADQWQFPKVFSNTPRTNKNPSTKKLTPINNELRLSEFFKELMTGNKGLSFLIEHYALFTYRFIIQLLPLLAEQGVRHIYDEAPSTLIHGFTIFNETGDIDLLIKNMKKMNMQLHQIEERCLLYQSAFKNNIKVFPVDRHMTKQQIEKLKLDEAVQERDNIIVRNIEYFNTSLPNNGKYLIIYGAAHYGLASQNNLNIPTCSMLGQKEKTSPTELLEQSKFNITTSSSSERRVLNRSLNSTLWDQLQEDDLLNFDNNMDYTLFLPNTTLTDNFLETKAVDVMSTDYNKTSRSQLAPQPQVKDEEQELQNSAPSSRR